MLRYVRIMLLLSVLLMLVGCGERSPGGEDAIVDHGDGTISNTHSGLMWTKKKTVRFASGEKARVYANEADVAGYTDWRLPTLDEFHALYYAIDFGQGSVRKTGISSEGDIWVIREQQIVSGAWEKEDTCCISRNFAETKKGRVWLVRP